MLKYLKIKNLGPAAEMELNLGERLNIITGDNGLGKTFLLDVIWWALTRNWADNRTIHPDLTKTGEVSVEYSFQGKEKGKENDPPQTRRYNRAEFNWEPPPKCAPPIPGIVVYARLDGGFSVWDPERNRWRQGENPNPSVFDFSKEDIKRGKTIELPANYEFKFKGIVDDWENWRLKGNGSFELLKNVLKKLSPDPENPLEPGESVRVANPRGQDIPLIKMPYGMEPILWASAGVFRILSLAYMLAWTWSEHLNECGATRDPENRIILLLDGVDAHLHPQWQQVIMPAILATLESLLVDKKGGKGKKKKTPEVQVIATTHAPLVLSSLETEFDKDRDSCFVIDFKKDVKSGSKQVFLHNVPFEKHGTCDNWFCTESFGLTTTRNPKVQEILDRASALMREEKPSPDEVRKTHAELVKALPPSDDFLFRWRYIAEKRGFLK